MGSLRKSKTLNIKGFFSWIYSLLGVWWVTVGLIFVVACMVGLSDLLLITVPFFVSVGIWIKKSEDGLQKIKDIFNSATSRVKKWWDNRPDFVE